MPRDEVENDPILCETSIITLRTGTNFALSDPEERRLVQLWTGGRREWEQADLVKALAFYSKFDVAGLAVLQGRYVSDCRKVLAAFENCDPARARRGTRPKAEAEAAWNEVFN